MSKKVPKVTSVYSCYGGIYLWLVHIVRLVYIAGTESHPAWLLRLLYCNAGGLSLVTLLPCRHSEGNLI